MSELSPNATVDQHEEAWAKIHDLLAAGHWARAREIFDQATSAERDLTEVTDVCDIEIRRRMELERELEVARENGYAAGRASTLTVPMSSNASGCDVCGAEPGRCMTETICQQTRDGRKETVSASGRAEQRYAVLRDWLTVRDYYIKGLPQANTPAEVDAIIDAEIARISPTIHGSHD